MTLGERIKACRQQAGMSQEKTADDKAPTEAFEFCYPPLPRTCFNCGL